VDVTLVARGAHAQALASGLVLEAPDETVTLPIPVVTDASALRWTDDTVVLLAVKGQDTEEALIQLVTVAPQETPIVCMQNGVENERRVLRRFPRTYGMCVMLPASHLRPGMVVAHSAPLTGLLDLGRYPSGVDDVADTIAEALQGSTFESVPRPDIMRWKYRKLIMNLTNAIEALSGREGRNSALVREAQQGGRGGGSSWQSLERGTGSIESEFLNGEIALLGALFGLDAPVNRRLMVLALQAAVDGRPAGSWGIDELSAAVGVPTDG
jgi:2-dehydropantoate 2-reductase